ncbi:unnamed protein product [Rotaria sp. Silwood2]|nr:unnamed protein product [Rotaria sp. Silwood2]CAF4326323.1 unnamed protein product [Rotaria sp. Silwood2]
MYQIQTIGLNVIDYDSITQDLPNEITKERLHQYLTNYEQVSIIGMPTIKSPSDEQIDPHTHEIDAADRTEAQYSTTTTIICSDDKENQTKKY